MSASATPPASVAHFSATELQMLAQTADALTAYLGKPVLAEVELTEQNSEWVTFGIPLDEHAAAEETQPYVRMGGPGARLLGSRGGLASTDDTCYGCLYLWAIQITVNEGERFIKLDQDGEESAWSDNLADVLPFVLSEDEWAAPEDQDEEEFDGRTDSIHGRPLYRH
jgi:hypothetical protein